LFCNVELESVIESIDVSTIYEVPLLMQKEKLDLPSFFASLPNLRIGEEPQMKSWKQFVSKLKNPKAVASKSG
jgi:CTP synthase